MKYRGHEMIKAELNGELSYFYADTLDKISENPFRDCGYCSLPNTSEGHDGCLGTLPNVMNACCGHGEDNKAYVQYPDEECVYGSEAVEIIKELKNSEKI